MRTRLRTALSATSLGVGVCLLAFQGTATASASAMPTGNAPSCVAVWQQTGTITKTGYARNDCGYSMNLKIVWSHGVDGSCQTARPGDTVKSKVPRGPRNFDGANLC
ncbi:hypothetical protein [Microtetraspora niveoalba]|uniref:hypothetical protein n=1 Tax=Microtetraspora niveoalba TaxID=46175 RepID=UPI00082E9627|nr:hypothetical protein [Microtetraspora niveoalba]